MGSTVLVIKSSAISILNKPYYGKYGLISTTFSFRTDEAMFYLTW